MARTFAQPKQSDEVSTIGTSRMLYMENSADLNYNVTPPTLTNSNAGGGGVKNNLGIVNQLVKSNHPVANPIKVAKGKYTDRIFAQGKR